MKLSIIMPVYNERNTIEEVINRVKNISINHELIIVDDHSCDGTRGILKKYINNENIKVLFHEKNFGKGHAIRTGLTVVDGNVVAIQDADLEYDPQDLRELVKPFLMDTARVVYGSRRLNPENKKSGVLFFFGGVMITYLSRLLFNIRITDEATCYKLIETTLIKSLDLKCERFEFCPEGTAKIAKLKIPIVEIPLYLVLLLLFLIKTMNLKILLNHLTIVSFLLFLLLSKLLHLKLFHHLVMALKHIYFL